MRQTSGSGLQGALEEMLRGARTVRSVSGPTSNVVVKRVGNRCCEIHSRETI